MADHVRTFRHGPSRQASELAKGSLAHDPLVLRCDEALLSYLLRTHLPKARVMDDLRRDHFSGGDRAYLGASSKVRTPAILGGIVSHSRSLLVYSIGRTRSRYW